MKFILFLLLSTSTISFSQIVNIENKRLSAQKQGFSGALDINVNYTLNSKSLLQIGSRVKLAYLKQRQYALILGDYSIIKSGSQSFINKGFEHIRYNYTLKDSGRFVYEVFQQGQFNKVQRINLRLLLGTGLRFMVINSKNYQLNIGTGFMGEYEELLGGEGSQDILSANYISFDGQFTNSMGLNSITYFQPKLIDYGNYRISNETALRFKINKNLSFKVIYALTHDSRSIVDVRKTNYTIKNVLSINL